MVKVTSLTALVLVVTGVYVLMSMFGPQVEAAQPTSTVSEISAPMQVSVIDALEASVAKHMADNPTITSRNSTRSTRTSSKNTWTSARMRVTGYCPCSKCCGKQADGITANGHYIRWGEKFIAADKKFAFGTQFRIPGYNRGRPVKVIDRGGAIKGNRLDLFFDTHSQAKSWGVKYLDVKIKR